ncbi:MAG TPA: hypothetical protein VGR07_18605 [Thermoanaerobaculia bacterium]|jgi:hypothetical protein|nr:hypothetical protein [Thermoanaerobaculia bacterium]
MNTVETVPSVTPPVNPAKGNQRGQTTLAAEIDRWQAMVDNLAPQVDQMPGLKETFVQFQAMLATAKSLRNQLNMLRAETGTALTQRNQLLVDGGDLFSRLQLGLQSIHGPRNPRLREFGLKPRGPRTGRPRKSAIPPSPVEITTVPPSAPATQAAKPSPGQ